MEVLAASKILEIFFKAWTFKGQPMVVSLEKGFILYGP